MKLFLFDLDQTLVNTGGAGLRALNRACEKVLGLHNAIAGISPHGKTDPAIVREILHKRTGDDSALTARLDSIIEAYLFFLREEVASSEGYRILPGIEETLAELKMRSDALLGLATGNVELGARIKLERARLNFYFEFGGFGSDSENRMELIRRAAEIAQRRVGEFIDPRTVFVIGDTPLDVDAGIRAGFQTIGVATGSYSIEQLKDSGAAIVISDFREGRDHFFRSTLTA